VCDVCVGMFVCSKALECVCVRACVKCVCVCDVCVGMFVCSKVLVCVCVRACVKCVCCAVCA